MLILPMIALDQVFHVGSLVLADRRRQASREANCLSVSVHPDEWGQIARIPGTCWAMTRASALWIDVTAIDDAQEESLMAWAVSEGLAEPVVVWRAWFRDGEADDWAYMRFDSEAAALWEIDDDLEDMDVGEGPSTNGTLLDCNPSHRLTAAGMERLERWGDTLDVRDGVTILYAAAVAGPACDDLVGLWWNETYDPLSLSCPRGGILPSKIAEFTVVPGSPDDSPSP